MPQIWRVVGGSDKGGILVRAGAAPDSQKVDERLVTGALVEQLAMHGERLHYRLKDGCGPSAGWVSLFVSGKELLVKVASPPEAPRRMGGAPLALLFPGQGSGHVGMLAGVKGLPAVREMLRKADRLLGYDILNLCLNGPEEKLLEAQHYYPAMFIAGLAGLEKLRSSPETRSKVEQATVMAGLSVGEFTALCAAGVLTFEDGLRLAKVAGEALWDAAADRPQLVLSVAGLERSRLQALCREAVQAEGRSAKCCITSSLFPAGYVCGGTETAVAILQDLVNEKGAVQSKVLPGVALHCPLMQPALAKFTAALEEVLPRMSPSACSVYMNASAKPVRAGSAPSDFAPLLKQQLTSEVLWLQTVQGMVEEGISDFIEVGPGRQLKSMMKWVSHRAWARTLSVEV